MVVEPNRHHNQTVVIEENRGPLHRHHETVIVESNPYGMGGNTVVVEERRHHETVIVENNPYGMGGGMGSTVIVENTNPYGGMGQAYVFPLFVQQCFNRRVHLCNLHNKFLVASNFGDRPLGHHDPNHGFFDSAVWIIEPHRLHPDRVSIRSAVSGAYLVHWNGQVTLHREVNWPEASWHFNEWTGLASFRTHEGHYLSIDEFGSEVHTVPHFDGRPHERQLFNVRYH